MKEITYTPIGIIRTPFMEPEGTPIQASRTRGVEGIVEVLPEYVPEFDQRKTSKVGWLKGKLNRHRQFKDDGRFSKE